jgi:very-short-patch-repair endonuclease
MQIYNTSQTYYKNSIKDKKRLIRKTFKKIIKERRIEARKNPTTTELMAKKLLIDNGITFEFQKIFKQYRVDFYLRKTRTVIEIDDNYHRVNNQKIKDKWQHKELMKHGKINHIIRFVNEDILYKPDFFISEVIKHIKITSDYHPTTNDRCIGSSDVRNSLEVGACANEIVVES